LGLESKETYVLLWSSYYAKIYNERRVIITGNPLLDHVDKDFILINKRNNNTKNILFCSDGFETLTYVKGKEFSQFILKLWETVLLNGKEFRFTIRPHPDE